MTDRDMARNDERCSKEHSQRRFVQTRLFCRDSFLSLGDSTLFTLCSSPPDVSPNCLCWCIAYDSSCKLTVWMDSTESREIDGLIWLEGRCECACACVLIASPSSDANQQLSQGHITLSGEGVHKHTHLELLRELLTLTLNPNCNPK